MIPAIAALLIKERDKNRQAGFAGMNGAADFIDANSGGTAMNVQPVQAPQGGLLAKMAGGMGEGMGEPSGWGWKEAANTAAPGAFTEGKFTPIAAMQQRFYDPYFGKNGKFNFTPQGPWRK